MLQQSVVESLLGFTAAVAEQCGDLLDGQSVDLEVGGGGDGDVFLVSSTLRFFSISFKILPPN